MRGIVLAAGEATRLPNKALLPISGNHIAVESAIKFCEHHCEDGITLVDSPRGLIRDVLKKRGNVWDSTVYQPEPLGVVDAITRALGSYDDYMITFCDCVYYSGEEVTYGASVRESCNVELDWWDYKKKEWRRRSIASPPESRFLGWLCFKQRDWLDAMCRVDDVYSLITVMNEMKLPAIRYNTPCWDIGTVDSYREYLEEGGEW